MRTLAGIVAALACASLISAGAGAKNITNSDKLETVDISYLNSYDYYGDYPRYYDDEDEYWEEHYDLELPVITEWSAEKDNVELFCSLAPEWDAEVCVVERRPTNKSEWETLGEYEVDYFSDSASNWFTDTNTPTGSVYYRFCYYKYFGSRKVLVTGSEILVYIDSGYNEPRILVSELLDTSVSLDITIDSRISTGECVVYRRTDQSESWKTVSTITLQAVEQWFDGAVYSFTDKKLKPLTTYYYKFEIYSADGTLIQSTEKSIQTKKTPDAPVALDPVAHKDSITVSAVLDREWKADGFEVLRYDRKKKKWEKIAEETYFEYIDWKDDGSYRKASYTDTGLKSATKYDYMIRLYHEADGKRSYFSKLRSSAYTLMPAPKLVLGATSNKASLSWSAVKGAVGYEVYVLPVSLSDSNDGWYWGWFSGGDGYTTTAEYDKSLAYYNRNYNSSTLYSQPISEFTKKSVIKDGKTSITYNIKSSKAYVYIVRGYKKIGKTKVYSEFSNQETTDCTSSLLNGIKLNSKVTVSDYDLGLIKKALNKCINNKMTNAEKAAAIYDYVHNVANYEYDYTKIPTDSVEAILSAGRGQCYQFAVAYQAMMKYIGFDVKLVSGKTSAGGPHWWCELTCAGTAYMIDPQVGGRFLIRYDRMGAYAVTKEKVYD